MMVIVTGFMIIGFVLFVLGILIFIVNEKYGYPIIILGILIIASSVFYGIKYQKENSQSQNPPVQTVGSFIYKKNVYGNLSLN